MAKQVLHYEREESLARQRQKARLKTIEPGTRYADPSENIGLSRTTPSNLGGGLRANWDSLFTNKLSGGDATAQALREIVPQLQVGGEASDGLPQSEGHVPGMPAGYRAPSLDALAKPPTHMQRWQNPSMAMPAAPFMPQPRSRQFIAPDASRRDEQGVPTGGIAEVERRSAMPGYFAPQAAPVAAQGWQTPGNSLAILNKYQTPGTVASFGKPISSGWDKLLSNRQNSRKPFF